MATDPGRERYRRTPGARSREGGRTSTRDGQHYIVCGTDPLAYRLVSELLRTPGARVTVIVVGASRPDRPDAAEIRGVRVIRAQRLDAQTFRSAGLDGADALALTHQDDVGNIHAALCAQEVNRRVRLVIRMFNTRLAQGVRTLFEDCAVMSDSGMAAPAFVAAALGEVSPTHFRLHDRTLRVVRRSEVAPRHVICGLAQLRTGSRPVVLPAVQEHADLVLAEATSAPSGTVVAARRLVRRRRRRRPFAVLLRATRALVNRTIGVAVLATLAVVAISGVALARAEHLHGWPALYLVILTTMTGAQAELRHNGVVQSLEVVLTVAGLALVPLTTAAVVDAIVNARLALDTGRVHVRRRGHVVLVGLGDVGTGVLRQLHDLGIEVVAVETEPTARGVLAARRRGHAVIIGDGAHEDTLHAASVETCQALVAVTADDATNLRAALTGLALRPDLRVVLRLFDDDFADRIQGAFSYAIFSRSVSYLAAPAFAAAMTDRDVIATIPVGRHVLLVAEVPVVAGSALDGSPAGSVSVADSVRLIALRRSGEVEPVWSPPAPHRIRAADRLIVVARRAGLTELHERADPPVTADRAS